MSTVNDLSYRVHIHYRTSSQRTRIFVVTAAKKITVNGCHYVDTICS